MQKLTIAIVQSGMFSVPRGGAVEKVIDHYSRTMQKDHRVVIYTRKGKNNTNYSRYGNIQYRRFNKNHHYLKNIIVDLKQLKPDIIQVEAMTHFIEDIRKHMPHTPIILNKHGMNDTLPPQISYAKMNEIIEKIDALFTNSDFLKQKLINHYPALKNKTYAVHLGIHSSHYGICNLKQTRIKKYKERFMLNHHDPVILFAGRLMRKKGLHHIINALPHIIKKHPRVKLLIVGSPQYGKNNPTSYVKRIQKKTKKWGSRIIFTNFIPPEDMPYMYQLADIIVTPSVWEEPFGLVNLEAMASGKPVVTTNRGGIPEVIEHKKTGYTLKLKHISNNLPKYINRLLNSQKERNKMGENGMKRAKQFTWQRTVDQYVSVYRNLLARRQQ